MADTAHISTAPVASDDWRSMVIVGYLLVGVGLFGTALWASFARLDGAVIAGGAISIESNRKTIQHLEGGIVQEILVRDGSVVHKGEVLVRLDVTRNQASDTLYRKQMAMALVLDARLNAQLNDAPSFTLPPEVQSMLGDSEVAEAVHDNQGGFTARLETLRGALEVVAQQEAQARRDVEQTTIQKKTAEDQMVAMEKEMAAVNTLLDKGLVSLTRVTALQRERIGLQGAIEAADVANSKGRSRLQELAAQAEQLRKEYKQEAAAAIPTVRQSLADLRQKIVVTHDSVGRSEIRAPVDGTVQQLRVFTTGGVIKAGDPILDIVPLSDTLVVRAQVATNDIDRVEANRPVEIRLPQFRTFESQHITGRVISVSQDIIQTGRETRDTPPYYAMEVEVQRDSIPQDIAPKLMAGMNVQVLIPTGERTVMEYLLSPLMDRINSGLRER